MTDPSPHSAAYFNDQRDHWWNADYLGHLAARWELSRVRQALDVGCGVGHWGRVLLPHLAPDARMVAFDREPRWVAEAHRRFPTGDGRVGAFLRADANQLPFAEGTFDLVTCQTVLMHLPHPRRALAEMVRVLRPGGWLMAAEPNNLFNCLDWSERTNSRPVEEVVALFELWLRYQRGKERQQRGDNSLGERLPGLLQDAGLQAIEARQNDRVAMLLPPYQAADQRAALDSVEEWERTGQGPWDLSELRDTYLAGGGTAEGFETAAQLLRRCFDERQRDTAEGKLRAAGGSLFFLMRGQKPEATP